MQEDFEHNTIGQRIEIARKYRGISRTELGKAIGFPPKSAYRRILSYEKGERVPKECTLQSIAKALKIDAYWFSLPDEVRIDNVFCFEYGAESEQKKHVKERLILEREIYNNLYRLSDDEIKKVIDSIHAKRKEEILCKKKLNRKP